MPTYQFKCKTCGAVETIQCTFEAKLVIRDQWPNMNWNHLDPRTAKSAAQGGWEWCPAPNWKEVFSFAIGTQFPDHINQATGQRVSNSRQHSDNLKRASEEATIRTGIEHNFVPNDLRDPDVRRMLGVTDEGVDRAKRAEKVATDKRTFGY